MRPNVPIPVLYTAEIKTMHFINAILKKSRWFILIYVDVILNLTILHRCFSAPLFQLQNLVCS